MATLKHEEDLDLLLSLQDRILETPPASPPSSPTSGYLSDDELPKHRGKVDMSMFREAVEDCLDYDVKAAQKSLKSKTNNNSDHEVEKFSGLRIRNQVMSSVELSNRFSDIRFVRFSAIKNLLKGDTLSGCWATVGILTEAVVTKRTSSTGKDYTIWKMSSLDEPAVSVFLFGDAYQKCCKEKVGTVFALFNSGVRKDKSENAFSLSVYTASNILKMGTSVDFGYCKGRNGSSCRAIINKRRGQMYCKYHQQKASEKYSSTRAEYKGGNLKTAFMSHMNSEGIYMVDRSAENVKKPKSKAPLKLLSVEGLKKALSNAGKTTTNMYSQGIRFLTEMTGQPDQIQTSKSSVQRSSSSCVRKETCRQMSENEMAAKRQTSKSSDQRSSSSRIRKETSTEMSKNELAAKKSRVESSHCQQEKGKGSELGKKMIELDFVDSDEEQ